MRCPDLCLAAPTLLAVRVLKATVSFAVVASRCRPASSPANNWAELGIAGTNARPCSLPKGAACMPKESGEEGRQIEGCQMGGCQVLECQLGGCQTEGCQRRLHACQRGLQLMIHVLESNQV